MSAPIGILEELQTLTLNFMEEKLILFGQLNF